MVELHHRGDLGMSFALLDDSGHAPPVVQKKIWMRVRIGTVELAPCNLHHIHVADHDGLFAR